MVHDQNFYRGAGVMVVVGVTMSGCLKWDAGIRRSLENPSKNILK